ncbi:hypothetical protein H4219_001779 [Mycoemilia scoparia]|uniref:Uncharacterized protein n=1 Tax=Mycoemilia scoparia TaxID=417184 RepID=A0A9W8A2R5_9FUNG|nr:hypothetical protein H4219_001779 [Mycoemilia scoparia]
MDDILNKESPEWAAKKQEIASSLKGKKLIEKDHITETSNNIPNAVLETELHNPYRIIKPGNAITMDFCRDRLNLKVDDDSVITQAGFY